MQERRAAESKRCGKRGTDYHSAPQDRAGVFLELFSVAIAQSFAAQHLRRVFEAVDEKRREYEQLKYDGVGG